MYTSYSLIITTDLLLFLGLILIINVYNFLNSRISWNIFNILILINYQ